jgi:DNA-binding response OmpR family regulator
MDRPVSLLILERDEEVLAFISAQLPRDFDLRIASTVEEAEALLDEKQPDLLLCADDLPVETGLMFLARTCQKWPALPRVLMMPDPDGDLFFMALREVPQLSYLSKPLEKRAFHRAIRHALWESPSDEDQPAAVSDPGEGKSPDQEAPAPSSPAIVIVESNPDAAARLIAMLPWGFRHHLVFSPEQAEAFLDHDPAAMLLCADDLEQESGLMFLARTQGKWPETKRILMLSDPDPEFFFHVSRDLPGFSYLAKPVRKSELLHLLRHGLHDVYTEETDDNPPPKTSSQLPPEIFRLMAWMIALVVGGLAVAGLCYAFYSIKCNLRHEMIPGVHAPDFLER